MNYEKVLVISMFCSRKPGNTRNPADELSGLRRDAEAEKRKGRFLVFPRTKEPASITILTVGYPSGAGDVSRQGLQRGSDAARRTVCDCRVAVSTN